MYYIYDSFNNKVTGQTLTIPPGGHMSLILSGGYTPVCYGNRIFDLKITGRDTNGGVVGGKEYMIKAVCSGTIMEPLPTKLPGWRESTAPGDINENNYDKVCVVGEDSAKVCDADQFVKTLYEYSKTLGSVDYKVINIALGNEELSANDINRTMGRIDSSYLSDHPLIFPDTFSHTSCGVIQINMSEDNKGQIVINSISSNDNYSWCNPNSGNYLVGLFNYDSAYDTTGINVSPIQIQDIENKPTSDFFAKVEETADKYGGSSAIFGYASDASDYSSSSSKNKMIYTESIERPPVDNPMMSRFYKITHYTPIIIGYLHQTGKQL